jgi:hypothetical protein
MQLAGQVGKAHPVVATNSYLLHIGLMLQTVRSNVFARVQIGEMATRDGLTAPWPIDCRDHSIGFFCSTDTSG